MTPVGSPTLATALRTHIEATDLEGQVKRWTPQQRQLVFPNGRGKITHHGQFLADVWRPLLEAAELPYRKPHSLRHTFASWLLEDGADIRYVQEQMRHASIEETVTTYGHCQHERHEYRVDQLDHYVAVPS